jgi:hypothetical protein
MNLDVDYLIDFFTKNSVPVNDDEETSEIGEQEDAAASSSPAPSTGGGGGGSVPKWSDFYQTKRGKANPLMASGQKWETGLARGSANQIW